jgi:hypothetical protein
MYFERLGEPVPSGTTDRLTTILAMGETTTIFK